MKRAAIYVRTSSEAQGEKASPKEQEADCLEYCQSHGYAVFDVYRDIEKYRVGRKLVEPSATRSDRPQLKRMLADGDAGLFDVIIAWREDRLYRGCTLAMVNLNDRVKNGTFSIELVKEFYDSKTAAVKAWAAGVELEAKHDRLIMGCKARFNSGKPWNNQTPYGYKIVDDKYVLDDHEAQWVHAIFAWFAEGVTVKEIRYQLIAGEAPERSECKYKWAIQSIYYLLKKEYYWTGIQYMNWDGVKYEISMPIIIDFELVQRVKARFARWKVNPAGNQRAATLVGGLIYCKLCGKKLSIKRLSNNIYYRCDANSPTRETSPVGCSKSRSMKVVDAEVWEKLWSLISEPGRFEAALAAKIEELQLQETDAEADCQRLKRELQNLSQERQKVITWARKHIITDDDLQIQLSTINYSENELVRELEDAKLLTQNHAGHLLEVARIYRDQVRAGMDAINAEPETARQAELQFQFKRKIVETVVTRVEMDAEKRLEIYTEFDFSKNISNTPVGWRRWCERT